MIRQNAHKYSVSAMCDVLGIKRSTYYYAAKPRRSETFLAKRVAAIFNENQRVYGARKIKFELNKQGIIVSRRRIVRMMKQQGLVSVYTVAQFKPHKSKPNEEPVKNELDRQFNPPKPLDVVVSDLTYVRVGDRWHYICVLVDLFNREIIGYSCGPNKDAKLVQRAFANCKVDLSEITIFHTDRGSEFKNGLIDEVVKAFDIRRSLSMKGCPYDNAVAEATFKIIKREFIYPRKFSTLDQLRQTFAAFVHWFNYKRIHSRLGYQSPVSYKYTALQKNV